ncbi:DNA polymerase domain-containing protein [Cohnella sp. CFH 77786]|uniref:non-homologous end-joining DNA ligase n=1 Tax=Cohnella sp. CFH 77786 TaxID=2662265 RepID=UPI001C608B8C|nr:non-homologous end-joining DNA ligase [Cohnella sp. CFH 77786]MBW5447540.1 DNA polymerase domain-containing protein [Cohnella sp. CFH 77786]
METRILSIGGKEIPITSPDLLLWPQQGITKWDYLRYLLAVAPFMIPYTRDRMLMIWRYPEGIGGRRIEERSIHGSAPDWVSRTVYNGKERILLNDAAVLAWAASRGALEFHVPFDRHDRKDYPTELVFDLDPSEGMDFGVVRKVAEELRKVLDSLSLRSFPKTSGATGLQIFVPIAPVYTFEQTRQLNRFIAEYMLRHMPETITLERVPSRRGGKLYFDYLQLWRGRTMAAVYSVRARPEAAVSAPVTWEEVKLGFRPTDFTVASMPARLMKTGDLFRFVSGVTDRLNQRLDPILDFVRGHT